MAAVDRISELPEPILHRILSSLSQKEAIQTSALSKTWRHVGPTRPKIELREGFFKKSSRASLLSVLGKTLQRYYHQNLSVDEFILEMSSSESDDQVIDSEFTNDPGKTLFKGLKRLSLNNVHIKDETALEKIVHSCSLIEYLNVSDCIGLNTIPLNIFQAEFLTELHISGRDLGAYGHLRGLNLIVSADHQLLLINRLKTLSLERVYILEETLDKIMCSCSLIEYLLVSNCFGLKTIPETIFQAEFLTELHLTGCRYTTENIIFTAPELILIKRLKTLSLKRVYISEETLDKIMCSCPLIERLFLTDCLGLRNIQLINNNNNLKHFSFSSSFYRGNAQSFAIHSPAIETISIMNCPNWYGHDIFFFPRLKSLYLSQVTLCAELFESFSSNFPSLEELQLVDCYGLEEIKLISCLIKSLVLLNDSIKPIRTTIYVQNIHYFKFSGRYPPKLIFNSETIREWKSHVEIWFNNKGEMSRGYLWERDLEEISMQVWDHNSQGWHTVCVEGTTFPGFRD